jgi:hypothetical protein
MNDLDDTTKINFTAARNIILKYGSEKILIKGEYCIQSIDQVVKISICTDYCS